MEVLDCLYHGAETVAGTPFDESDGKAISNRIVDSLERDADSIAEAAARLFNALAPDGEVSQ